MKHTTLPTLPLTEEERFHLQTIYGTRLRNLAAVYAFLILGGLYASFASLGKSRASYRAYDYEIAGVILSKQQARILIAGVLEAIIIGSGVVFFARRVLPFKKDLRLGLKEEVTYTIVHKRHFELTGQCFFSFDDPAYMHHEVEADVYNSFNEGDTVGIYRGIHSKYVFHKDGKFSFI